MRNSRQRELSALGIKIKDKIAAPGIDLYQASLSGQDLLVWCERRFGITWPILVAFLISQNVSFEAIRVSDRVYLVTGKDAERILGSLSDQLLDARRKEIFIRDLGFMKEKSQRRFELRNIVLPVLVLVSVLLAATYLSPRNGTEAGVVAHLCVADLSGSKLEKWLGEELSRAGPINPTTTLRLDTPDGSVQISATQAIGTISFLTVKMECASGSKRQASFRYDLAAKTKPTLLEDEN
ncbi:MAG: hypothetical protein ACKOXT_03410 [Actinomycetota bacterium]